MFLLSVQLYRAIVTPIQTLSILMLRLTLSAPHRVTGPGAMATQGVDVGELLLGVVGHQNHSSWGGLPMFGHIWIRPSLPK